MKLAVLSDIHAAANAYEAALRAARVEGFDQLLILGDLLTYGPHPERTIELTADAVSRDGAQLLIGNHDQLYQAAGATSQSYCAGLPEWIRESIGWTLSRTGSDPLSRFNWLEEWAAGDLLAAHANPFGVGDWTYLNGDAVFDQAGKVLEQRGFRYGVFGHTHRFACRETVGNWVATVGSVGQPRDRTNLMPQWAVAYSDGRSWKLEQRHVEFDWSSHRAAIETTSMSETTKERICGFFA